MLSRKDLNPDAAPPRQGNISYQQTHIPVTVKPSRRGSNYTIDLYAHDIVFDYETYIDTPESFAVVHAAGEDYNPPIPLLTFPLNTGGVRTWSGTLSSEENPHAARATITVTDGDRVVSGQSEFWTVRINVEMTILPYRGESEITRHLTFWFDPHHGLIKRNFADTSIREPVVQ